MPLTKVNNTADVRHCKPTYNQVQATSAVRTSFC